jgi:hypothetical protein
MDEPSSFRRRRQERIDALGPCCSCLVIVVVVIIAFSAFILR